MKKRFLAIVLSVTFLFCLTAGCASTYKVHTTVPVEYQQVSPETK